MKDVIKAFDEYLATRDLEFAVVVIGGGALIVMDVIDRKTKDIDCLDPDIPEEIKSASVEFARARTDLALWVKGRDANAGWPVHVEIAFKSLSRELGYE
jgi:hypothetical protein